MWQGKDEPLLNHANTGDNTSGVVDNRACAVGNRGAVEIDWQNGKTYES